MRNDILNILSQEKVRNAYWVKSIENMTLKEYLSTTAYFSSPNDQFILKNREIFLTCLKKLLQASLSDQEIEKLLKQFNKYPIFQTSDSCQLIYDPETFLNNFLFNQVIEDLNEDYLLVQQCSTVRLLMSKRPVFGPGFLNIQDNLVNIFGERPKKLAKSNVATSGEVTFQFNGCQNLNPTFKTIKGMSFKNADDAFCYANNKIWDSLKFTGKRKLIILDERLSNDVVAEMIKDEANPLYQIIFNKDHRNLFLSIIDNFIQSGESLVLRNTSQFFFVKVETSLQPGIIINKGNEIFISDINQKIIIPLNSEKIIEALNSRQLFPNLIVAFLALSVFPCVTVCGGASQFEYFSEIQSILNSFNKKANLIDAITMNHLLDKNLTKNISGLIELESLQGDILKDIFMGCDLSLYKNMIMGKELGSLMGDLNYFNYFKKLIERRNITREKNYG